MSKHYHLRFDTKIGHGICEINSIPCACSACTSILQKPWISDITPNKQARHQHIKNWTYWKIIGLFKNWNTIQLSQKSTPFEAFEVIHQVFLDDISDNMASLFQYGKYCAINTADTIANGFYVIKFISEA